MKTLLLLCVLFCGCATTNQVTLVVEIPNIQKPTQGVTFRIMVDDEKAGSSTVGQRPKSYRQS